MTKDFYKKNGEWEEGVYSYFNPKNLVYFAGKYNEDGHAKFEGFDGKEIIIPKSNAISLTKLSKEEIKSKVSWLERALDSEE